MISDFVVMGLTLLVIIGLVVLRGRSGGKYDVKLSDAAIAAILIALWLLVSGKISKLAVGSEGVTVETAILKASQEDISSQIVPLVIGPVDKAGRNAEETISHVVADRAEALSFVIGANEYNPEAIEEELTVLTQHVFFNYVILTHEDGSLFGMLNAHKLVRILERQPGPYSWVDFAKFINVGDSNALHELRGIPSFIDGTYAITESDDKSEVLKKMQDSRFECLPVVDSEQRFLGVISRSQVTASLILQIAEQLSN